MVASGFYRGEELYIHQDAALSLGKFDAGKELTYQIAQPGNGVYIMVVEGSVTIDGHEMNRRDAIGVWETADVKIQATTASELLFIDVPMN